MRRPDAGYRCYAELAQAQAEGEHFSVRIGRRPRSPVAILAPHGGGIENGTSEIVRAVAGDEFNFYLFEGLRAADNYALLHLTSHRFDEPRCLELLAGCDHVVAIHGCRGEVPQALVGGRDTGLARRIHAAVAAAGIEAHLEGHRFPAVDPQNVCNRGRRGAGVQIELTSALRERADTTALVAALRVVLLAL